MSSGLTGEDVSQLQAGLQGLGLLAESHTAGTFDRATAQAVAALYQSHGYTSSCDGSPLGKVCLGEVAFLPSLPATVAAVNVRLGDAAAAGSSLMTLQLGAISVTATVPGGQQSGVVVGLPVLIADDSGQRQCAGSVASVGSYIGASTDNSGTSMAGYPLTVNADDCLDATWLNLNVRLVIDITATAQPVLIVPTMAVQTDDTDSAHYVVVLDTDGTSHRVDVTPGLVAAGEVEVRPAPGQDLTAGDVVVTG